MKNPLLSIVLGTYNRKKFLKLTIDSIRYNDFHFPYEIIVIDGGSTDGSLGWLAKQKDIISIIQHNRGEFQGKKIEKRNWGYFMNLGFKIAQGKYICMISDDCLLTPGSLKNAVNQFEENLRNGKKIGAIAFYWRDSFKSKKYWVGVTLGEKIFVNHGIYLKNILEKAGWCDEETYNFYHGDGDLSLKIWNEGYEILDAENSYVEHFHDATLRIRKKNMETQEKDYQIYITKWQSIFSPGVDKDKAAIFREHDDPHETANKFPKLKILKVIIKRKIKKMI